MHTVTQPKLKCKDLTKTTLLQLHCNGRGLHFSAFHFESRAGGSTVRLKYVNPPQPPLHKIFPVYMRYMENPIVVISPFLSQLWSTRRTAWSNSMTTRQSGCFRNRIMISIGKWDNGYVNVLAISCHKDTKVKHCGYLYRVVDDVNSATIINTLTWIVCVCNGRDVTSATCTLGTRLQGLP